MNLLRYRIITEAAGNRNWLDIGPDPEAWLSKVVKDNARKCNEWSAELNVSGIYTGSRIGGIPYIGDDDSQFRAYTENINNEFVAQINLSDVKVRDGLPASGILQFWVNNGNYDEHGSVVIYYPSIHKIRSSDVEEIYTSFRNKYPEYYELHVSGLKNNLKYSLFYDVPEKVLKYGTKLTCKQTVSIPPLVTDLEINSRPLYAITSTEQYNVLYDIYPSVVNKVLGIDIDKRVVWNNTGGHATSMQDVPFNVYGKYVLLQLDSSSPALHKLGLNIGDNGIMRWTISQEDLKRKNFSEAINTWECY